jgi:hypothetical protein
MLAIRFRFAAGAGGWRRLAAIRAVLLTEGKGRRENPQPGLR